MKHTARVPSLLATAVAVQLMLATLAATSAQEGIVWELSPYRIQVLLIPDGDPVWSETVLDRLGESVREQTRVEIGRAWQLEVQCAEPLLCTSVLAAADALPDSGRCVELLQPYHERDKVVLVVLRSDNGGRTAVAWELDWAARRWTKGPLQWAASIVELQQAVFESIDSVVAPLGQVRLASGQRVVLRQRAALLPVRNHRRSSVSAGSLLEVLPRDRNAFHQSPEDKTLLVVEELNEQGVVCRIMSLAGNPLERTPVDSWVAIQARLVFSQSRFHLTMSKNGSSAPLAECQVWVSEQREQDGSFVGCPSADGVIVLPAVGQAQWLRIRVGAVLLREYCVVAGARTEEVIATRVTEGELNHAGVLACSRDDVVELMALRDTYLARHQHRIDAGRDGEAKSLLQEADDAINPRIDRLLETIRQRRNQLIAADANEADRFAPQWSELVVALEDMRR